VAIVRAAADAGRMSLRARLVFIFVALVWLLPCLRPFVH